MDSPRSRKTRTFQTLVHREHSREQSTRNRWHTWGGKHKDQRRDFKIKQETQDVTLCFWSVHHLANSLCSLRISVAFRAPVSLHYLLCSTVTFRLCLDVVQTLRLFQKVAIFPLWWKLNHSPGSFFQLLHKKVISNTSSEVDLAEKSCTKVLWIHAAPEINANMSSCPLQGYRRR